MSKLCERSNPLGVRLDGLPRRQTILPGEGSPGAPVFYGPGPAVYRVLMMVGSSPLRRRQRHSQQDNCRYKIYP